MAFKDFSADNFVADLNNLPWNTMEMFTDVNEALEHWQALFNDVLNSHAPLKKKRVKRLHQPEWFTDEFSDAIKKRNNLHQRAISINTTICWRDFRSARNRVVH